MAGIINIALKQNVDLGLSGALQPRRLDADQRYNSSGNIGYQSGPWTSFINAGVVTDERNVDGINDRERYDAVRNLLSRHRPGRRTRVRTCAARTSTPRSTTSSRRATCCRTRCRSTIAARATDSMNAYSELNGSGALLDRYARPRDAGRERMDGRLRRRAQAHVRAAQARALGRAAVQSLARSRTSRRCGASRRRRRARRVSRASTTTTTRSRSSSPASSTT